MLWTSLLFPVGFKTPSERAWGRGYEIYEVSDVLRHSQHLVRNYYRLPEEALGELAVYNEMQGESQVPISVPALHISRWSSTESVERYALHNETRGWPLAEEGDLAKAIGSGDTNIVHDFFNDLESMTVSERRSSIIFCQRRVLFSCERRQIAALLSHIFLTHA